MTMQVAWQPYSALALLCIGTAPSHWDHQRPCGWTTPSFDRI